MERINVCLTVIVFELAVIMVWLGCIAAGVTR